MAFDGNGTFNRLYSWVQDDANGINITAARVEAEDSGFAAGLSNCLTRDGQGKAGADFTPAVDAAYALGNGGFRWKELNISGNVGFGGRLIWSNQPAFTAERVTSSQNITSNATTTLLFNQSVGSGAYVPGTGLYTAPFSGVFILSACITLQNNASGIAPLSSLFFARNGHTPPSPGNAYLLGDTVQGNIAPGSTAFSLSGSVVLILTAGDTVSVGIIMGVIGGSGNFQMLTGSYFSVAPLAAAS